MIFNSVWVRCQNRFDLYQTTQVLRHLLQGTRIYKTGLSLGAVQLFFEAPFVQIFDQIFQVEGFFSDLLFYILDY